MTPLQRAVLGYRRRAPSSKHAQLWQAMRILRRFTLLDLMATCEQDNKRTVSTYVSQLRSAGYAYAFCDRAEGEICPIGDIELPSH